MSYGVTYYPNKYWALALPVYFVVAVFTGTVLYIAANFMVTAPLDSFETITDSQVRAENVYEVSGLFSLFSCLIFGADACVSLVCMDAANDRRAGLRWQALVSRHWLGKSPRSLISTLPS